MGNKIEADSGAQSGVITDPAKRVKELERNNRELNRANKILRRACPTKCFGHNALVDTINGLYQAEAIHKDGPWRGLDDVAQVTLTRVDWFDNHRLLRPNGDVPPTEFKKCSINKPSQVMLHDLN